MLVDHPSTPPFIVEAAHPEDGHELALARIRRARRGRCSRTTARAFAATWPRSRARSCSIPRRAARARSIRDYGRLREPALFWTAMIRALDVVTDGFPYDRRTIRLPAAVPGPDRVRLLPRGLRAARNETPAPEFGIFTSAEFLDRANQINDLLYNGDQSWPHLAGARPRRANALGTPSPAAHRVPCRRRQSRCARRAHRSAVPARHDERGDAQDIVNAVNKLPPRTTRCDASRWRST